MTLQELKDAYHKADEKAAKAQDYHSFLLDLQTRSLVHLRCSGYERPTKAQVRAAEKAMEQAEKARDEAETTLSDFEWEQRELKQLQTV